LCVDADITDEILFRAVLKYYAFNEKKTMISKLLNAEGKVQEKAAAVATGTVGAGALESTNSDKVSVIVVVD
jgi:microcompartment protein CcmK/EutM